MFRILASLALAGFFLSPLPVMAEGRDAVVYKSPWCGCCSGYVKHLEEAGYHVEVKEVEDLDPIKKLAGVPVEFQSCHTMQVGGYVVEGHVPLETVAKLLDEKPAIRGIALPGMPEGTPGMPGEKAGPFEIYTLSNSPTLFDVR